MRPEERDDGRVAIAFCDAQRRIAVLVRPVDLRAVVQQQPRRVDLADLASDEQGRPAVLNSRTTGAAARGTCTRYGCVG